MGDTLAAATRLAAVDRALANPYSNAVGDKVRYAWVAAIGIRETQFQNINQSGGGPGQGVYQITVPGLGVSSAQAHDLFFATRLVAQYLLDAGSRLSQAIPGLSLDALTTAILSSYNHGVGGATSDLTKGLSSDANTTGRNYGSNILKLTKCF